MKIAMTMSMKGITTLLEPSEAWRSKPYNDASHNASIAWGHKLHDGPVTPADWAKYGKGITLAQGFAFLQADTAWASKEVSTVVEPQLNQNQFDAIADFTYNEGSGTLEKSSVLKFLNERTSSQLATRCSSMSTRAA